MKKVRENTRLPAYPFWSIARLGRHVRWVVPKEQSVRHAAFWLNVAQRICQLHCGRSAAVAGAPPARGVQSGRVAGSPNRGTVVGSKRVRAEIWVPDRVRTISPTV